MTPLRHLADGARFLTASGVHGQRISDRGLHGVRVKLEVEGQEPVVRYLHGGMRVYEMPSLLSSCRPPTVRPRTFMKGDLDGQTFPVHAEIPAGQRRIA